MTQNHTRMLNPTFYRNLGRNIRLIRSAAGKTQMEAAEHLDVSFIQYQKYEAGRNRIPVDRLVKLSAYLEIPLSEFLGTTNSSRANPAVQSLIDQIKGREFEELLRVWTAMKDRRVRAVVLDLAKSTAALGAD
jgi:transcriptional regulator with XRE-family HTH domain